jgi:tripartite-type tricarboxylate transporter receptor subunit TctC
MNKVLAIAFGLACLTSDPFVGVARAEEAATRPIMLVIPTAVGGAPDTVGRVLASNMGNRLRTTVVTVNRPGASGTIAARAVAQANPDGHTLLLGVAANLAVAANALAGGYDPTKWFASVGLIQRGPYAVFVSTSLPVSTFRELLAHAKKEPGRLNFATPGVASAHHLAWELLMARTGVRLVHVPFQGLQMVTETVAGRTQVVMTSPGSTLRQLADASKLKIIATSGAKRLDQLSHLPTISEQGVPGYEAYSWWGLVAPSGTPPSVVARLNTALNAALDVPEIRERLRAEGVPEERFATTPEAFGAWIAAEYALWGKVIRERNIRFD